MDPTAFKKNNSNLIKLSEKTKKQAMRRLIGSIFLLLLALILLLDVTTKAKPIAIIPQTIEVKHNSSSGVVSNTIITIESSDLPIAIESINTIDKTSPPAKTITYSNNSNSKRNPNKLLLKTILSGQVIEEHKKLQINPEDILNNNIKNNNESKYYIQLAALNDKIKLKHIQQELAINNIKTFIEPIKNNMYRLRVGPFLSKEQAITKLGEINNLLISNNF